jgi:hypothetical protein
MSSSEAGALRRGSSAAASAPTGGTQGPTLLPSALPRESSESLHSPHDLATPGEILLPHHPLLCTLSPDAADLYPTQNLNAFQPFFTLVESLHASSSSSSQHHPTVHYIFSDDDPESITDAALRIHDASIPDAMSSHLAIKPHERFILVDLCPDGRGVASARSMTADFAVVGAECSAAPTMEGVGGGVGVGQGEGAGQGGLMLRIKGVEQGRGLSEGELEGMGLEGLVEEYRRRMGELRSVVEQGERGEQVARL